MAGRIVFGCRRLKPSPSSSSPRHATSRFLLFSYRGVLVNTAAIVNANRFWRAVSEAARERGKLAPKEPAPGGFSPLSVAEGILTTSQGAAAAAGPERAEEVASTRMWTLRIDAETRRRCIVRGTVAHHGKTGNGCAAKAF